ncbi:AraC family transcriptional regulator [Paenibacillus psychroresistens]|uniref:AraC family transcriptional regulator n=1 Tax=Paenibacillus psychroresistens TaxID=1778678 RepID=A0A6B8RGN6_9BACL|nr:AraC family transcriptional regulator [Paenibacillus psychroresistens]QGQ94536.1 AraC family transcriptional regulator [Paenibacillus psychroresistens]
MKQIVPDRLMLEDYMSNEATLRVYHFEIFKTSLLHWHEFYELVLVIAGTATHGLNGKSIPLRRGSLFLLTPADFHEINVTPGESLLFYNVIFSGIRLDEPLINMLFEQDQQHYYDFTEPETKRLEVEFTLMQTEENQQQIGQDRLIQGALERILIELVRAIQVLSVAQISINKPLIQPSIRKAMIYIEHHFRENITLEEVARQAQLVPNYFSTCFRKMTSITFQQYLQDLRIHFAKSLLQASRLLSVTEICYASGFNNLSHFIRVFKQKTGYSPNVFRGHL